MRSSTSEPRRFGVDAEHGELLGPIADAHDVGDAAPADQIDDGEVLCQLDGFVESEEERCRR